jgi:hypothetical protein
MSDGETAEAALASVTDAVAAWIEEATVLGRASAADRHVIAWQRSRVSPERRYPQRFLLVSD